MESRTERAHRFAAVGTVVEILEEGDRRRARIVVDPGTVLDVATGAAADLHLGDQVALEGLLTVDHLATIPGPATTDR